MEIDYQRRRPLCPCKADCGQWISLTVADVLRKVRHVIIPYTKTHTNLTSQAAI